MHLDEHLDYNNSEEALAGAAGRALGKSIPRFKHFRNVGFCAFEKLYHIGVVPVLDCYAGVWGHH